MKIAFRTDASIQIGSGHVMRCLTLADALRERGAQCNFICREHAGNMNDLIRARGYAVEVLPLNNSNASAHESPAHEGWLGAEWQDDAEQTRRALADITVDWLIVDHYALDICWEHQMRGICRRLMVIDDLADRTHDCDLLLDQNYSDNAGRYGTLVPDSTRIRIVPRYALLQPEYQRSQVERSEAQAISRVLVFFGGSDPDDMTRMTLEAHCAPQF